MQAERKIRLNVITNTGLDFVFAAEAFLKISSLIKQIECIYTEISGTHKKIKQGSIKKGNFLVPYSQCVGDIFSDNDEIICEMRDFEEKNKNQIISEKANLIKQEKQRNNKKVEKKVDENKKEKVEGNKKDKGKEGQKEAEVSVKENKKKAENKGQVEDKEGVAAKLLAMMKATKNSDNNKPASSNSQQKPSKNKDEPKIIIKQSDSE